MKKAFIGVLLVLSMGVAAQAATVHHAVAVTAKAVAKATAKTSVAVAKSVRAVAKHL